MRTQSFPFIRVHLRSSAAIAFLLSIFPALASALPPFADIHMHYKWSQAEVTSPEQAIAVLKEQNIVLAVVIGSPPEFAHQLADLDPERVIPVYGPYNGKRNWFRWARDLSLVSDAREALASGKYHGVGELHMIGGFSKKLRNAAVLDGLMELGAEFQKPLIIHSEYARPGPFLDLCKRHPKTPVLWAHTGAILKTKYVREVMDACPGVLAELSARDPWRYVRNPIHDEATGRLLPEWEQLVLDYPNRFLVGSDPVWPVEQLDAWDQADTGWDEVGRFLSFHRKWLSFLPKDMEEKIRLSNAQRLFGTKL